eukprot:m.542007 g.542007  ORF g.542007 m.542007 type:complete len:366 (-) comp57656_c0_seq4:1523-2620(-)
MDSLLEFANGFHWERGTTFMSAPQHVATALGSYIAVSFLLQYLMRSRPAFKLTGLVCLHNAGLCLLSVCMFLGTVYEIASIAFGHYAARPAFGALCDPDRVVLTGSTRFPFWSYIFYLSKYWEMLDTYILALKKKPLTFLQMYHHFIIVVLCWLWLDDSWSIHWVAVSLNSLVHVFMYYYFSLSALGYRIWWKSYLTAFQLVQFTIVTVLIGAWYFLALDISITCEILGYLSLYHPHVKCLHRDPKRGPLQQRRGSVVPLPFWQFLRRQLSPRKRRQGQQGREGRQEVCHGQESGLIAHGFGQAPLSITPRRLVKSASRELASLSPRNTNTLRCDARVNRFQARCSSKCESIERSCGDRACRQEL